MLMNSFTGKQVLALIRNSDYAHAGEEEAIEVALRPYPKRPSQWILDAGCGGGGTARFIREQGWGRVVGIDLEEDSIRLGRRLYPGLELHACDMTAPTILSGRRFDLVYLFNSFYAVTDQPRALSALGRIAPQSGQLMIFDYVDHGGFDPDALQNDGEPLIPHPLQLDTIGVTLRAAGWQLLEIRNLDEAYKRWYTALLRRIERKRAVLVEYAGAASYEEVHALYAGLLTALQAGTLGGAIVRARRLPVR